MCLSTLSIDKPSWKMHSVVCKKNYTFFDEKTVEKKMKLYVCAVYHGICLRIDPPPCFSMFENRSILKIFRPPSAAGFFMISEGGTLLIFQKLENRPPLVSQDPDFEGGGLFSKGGGLFSNISPD